MTKEKNVSNDGKDLQDLAPNQVHGGTDGFNMACYCCFAYHLCIPLSMLWTVGTINYSTS